MKAVEGLKDWTCKSLRDLATINYGRSPAAILAVDGLYPVVGTGGAERLGNDYLYEGDSIILGRKGTIDRVHFATGRFWTIDTAYYLSNFKDSVPQWLFYFLQTIDLRQMNEATGVPSLSRDSLYKIEIPAPPKPEQTKIAEILSTVDRAIEQTEALIAKQQRIKTGLMQDLLTRGIDEHGNLRSEQTHEFKDSPLGRIPVEWDVVTFGDICAKAINGGTPSTEIEKYWEGYIPWITGADILNQKVSKIRRYITEEAVRNSSTNVIPKGNMLIVTRTGVGKLAIAPFDVAVSQDFTGIVPNEKIKTEFLFWLLNNSTNYFLDLTQGTSINGITRKDLIRFVFSLPPLPEQRRIAEILIAADDRIEKEEAYQNKLQRTKTALMQDLLKGKKRVTTLLKQEVTNV
ncbi:MAG: restriction endonuclease subunit S [Anaerolineaceae bacterium]|nr:restriction endonuclease subunit S [Anaerolineaceae bacterium]